eukprot:11192193-Lingulodinium_polyedra.AAC.1
MFTYVRACSVYISILDSWCAYVCVCCIGLPYLRAGAGVAVYRDGNILIPHVCPRGGLLGSRPDVVAARA